MCLAIPAKLVTRTGDTATADLHGNRIEINTALVPQATVGDWVLIHAGFAIQRLDCDEAESTWAVLQDIRNAEASATATCTTETPRHGEEHRGNSL